jgi:hypothetical protein
MNERVMSRSEAAVLIMDMARGGVSRQEVEALQLGVRALVKRHFDCMKNRAKRRDGLRGTDAANQDRAEPAIQNDETKGE